MTLETALVLIMLWATLVSSWDLVKKTWRKLVGIWTMIRR